MATARAIANGNWSATATWNGGVLPGNGDTVYANSFTVTIDQNVDIGGTNNPIVNAGSFVSGQWYEITSVGTTSFTSIGASANSIGIVFLATGVGSGTGQARARATLTTASNTAAGATSGGGGFAMSTSYNMTCDQRAGTTVCLTFSGSQNFNINNVIITSGSISGANGVNFTGTGTLFGVSITAFNTSSVCHGINCSNGTIDFNNSIIYGALGSGYGINCSNGTIKLVNCSIQSLNSNNANGVNITSGILDIDSSTFLVTGTNTAAVVGGTTSNIFIKNSSITANTANTISTSGSITCTNCTFTAANGVPAVTSSNTSGGNRFSGTFISSVNGTQPINATRWILNSIPTASYIQHALDGINANSFVRFYTADTSLGQAAPTDVRTGVSYASGALTGRLTVPSEGSVSNGVTVGPLMPFTATRSSTTATATLAYSYPYVAGDTIVVTGASNAEWNGTYTIASVISGTSITFAVPVTYSSTAGTGAQMQTVGTAMLTAAAIFNTLTSTMTTVGSIGERLANVSTVAVTGQQITSALG